MLHQAEQIRAGRRHRAATIVFTQALELGEQHSPAGLELAVQLLFQIRHGTHLTSRARIHIRYSQAPATDKSWRWQDEDPGLPEGPTGQESRSSGHQGVPSMRVIPSRRTGETPAMSDTKKSATSNKAFGGFTD